MIGAARARRLGGWGFVADSRCWTRGLFRNRAFSTGVFSITLQFFVFFGYVFVIVQYLQLVLDYSPLQAGLALVPMAMVLGGLSRRVPHLMGKVSRRPLTIAGLLLMALGTVVLAQLGPDSSYWVVLAGILPIGAGHGAGDVAGHDRHRRRSAGAQAGRRLGGQRRGTRGRRNPRHRSPGERAQRAVPVRAARSRADICSRLASSSERRSRWEPRWHVASHLGDGGKGLADAARDAFTGGASDAFYLATGLLCLAALRPRGPDPGQVRSRSRRQRSTTSRAAPVDAVHR